MRDFVYVCLVLAVAFATLLSMSQCAQNETDNVYRYKTKCLEMHGTINWLTGTCEGTK